ncbi:MAG: protein kinase domain-containing protein [Dehalococcoidia bacterium]
MDRIGRYEIRKVLGRGAQGTVYLAFDPDQDREVALKVLPGYLIGDADARRRFDRELRMLLQLEHQHIVPVHNFWLPNSDEPGEPYIVMRYMAGGSLRQRLTEQGITDAEAMAVLASVAKALDGAHLRGVVHRDVKPENILFDQWDAAYLADLGVAHATATVSGSVGIVAGTPAYMPPEQWRGDQPTPAADVYALGIVAYELLVGRAPFLGATTAELMRKHLDDLPPRPRTLRPELPRLVEHALMDALAKDPADRWPSAGEFVRNLERGMALLPAASAATRTMPASAADAAPGAAAPASGADEAPGAAPEESRLPSAETWVLPPEPDASTVVVNGGPALPIHTGPSEPDGSLPPAAPDRPRQFERIARPNASAQIPASERRPAGPDGLPRDAARDRGRRFPRALRRRGVVVAAGLAAVAAAAALAAVSLRGGDGSTDSRAKEGATASATALPIAVTRDQVLSALAFAQTSCPGAAVARAQCPEAEVGSSGTEVAVRFLSPDGTVQAVGTVSGAAPGWSWREEPRANSPLPWQPPLAGTVGESAAAPAWTPPAVLSLVRDRTDTTPLRTRRTERWAAAAPETAIGVLDSYKDWSRLEYSKACDSGSNPLCKPDHRLFHLQSPPKLGDSKSAVLVIEYGGGRLDLTMYDVAIPDSRVSFVTSGGRIRITNLNGTGSIDVGSDGASYPALRSDGRILAYVAPVQDGGPRQLLLLDLESGESRLAVPAESDAEFRTPAWSPDGRSLAYAKRIAAGPWALYIVDSAGEQALLESPTSLAWPSFSPDGQEVVYQDGKDLWIVNRGPDAPQPARLVSGVSAMDSHWAPNNKDRIAFAAISGGDPARIMIIDRGSDSAIRLSHGPGSDIWPSWVGGTGALLFTRQDEVGNRVLWLALGIGEPALRLPVEGTVTFPGWGPAVSAPISVGVPVTVVVAAGCLSLRERSTTASARIACAPAGSTARVLDGPRAADGHQWWLIEVLSDSAAPSRGWAADAALDGTRWLQPGENVAVAASAVLPTPTPFATPTPANTVTPTSTPPPTPTAAGPPHTAAELVFPRAGSVLLGSTLTFTWASGTGNTRFDLWVGSSPDAADIYDRPDGPGTSQVVDNIPVDGRPIYVRLTSSDGTEAGTFIRSYTFTASRN